MFSLIIKNVHISFQSLSIALAMMRLGTSPMPIGRTLGFLFKGIKRHATYADTPSGSTAHVHKRFAMPASALHKSTDAPLKDEHRQRHPYASTPDGPAAPFVRIAAYFILSPVILSNIIGSKHVSSACCSQGRDSGTGTFPLGCF